MTDVVVIGAGIIGAAIGLRLTLDGFRIQWIDGQDPMDGCSAGNAGHLTQANIFPPVLPSTLMALPKLLGGSGPLRIEMSYLGSMLPWMKLALEASSGKRKEAIVRTLSMLAIQGVGDLQSLAKSANAADLIDHDGVIYAYGDQRRFEGARSAINAWTSSGISAEALDRQRLLDMEPALASSVAGGIYFTGSGRCKDPRRLGLKMIEAARLRGARLLRADVRAVRPQGQGYEVISSGARIVAPRVVVCAGIGSGPLMRSLNAKVPLASERGYHLMLHRPTVELGRPIAFPEHYFIATAMNDGLRLAGTAEFARPGSPPRYERADSLLSLARKFLPALHNDGSSRWMGVRPSLPDGVPAIGEFSNAPGLYYAFGHGHSGLTLSGFTARFVSDLFRGHAPSVDQDALALERFS